MKYLGKNILIGIIPFLVLWFIFKSTDNKFNSGDNISSFNTVAVSKLKEETKKPKNISIEKREEIKKPEQQENLEIETKKETKKPKNVRINGKIINIIPLVGSFAYQVEDNTGKIWVMTEDNPPEIDQEIIINGILTYEDITVEDKSFGEFYVVESTREIQD